MDELIIASANQHKIEELSAILPKNIKLVSMKDAGITEDIPETATTLEGNALIKARYIFERIGKACFADDTGLEVTALNNEPGVYSARYAERAGCGTGHQANDNKALLLRNLEGVSDRSARFRTVIALIDNEGREHLFEGEVRGVITTQEMGSDGFGYDPIFVPDGFVESFAEMPSEQKNSISHRGRAAAGLVSYLGSL